LSQEGKITWKTISVKLNFQRELSSKCGLQLKKKKKVEVKTLKMLISHEDTF